MNTIVRTYWELDLGAGPSTFFEFVNCRYHVDDKGTCHIVDDAGTGNVTAFADGEWRCAVRGVAVTHPSQSAAGGGLPTEATRLEVVR